VGKSTTSAFPANCAVVVPALNEEAAVAVTVRQWLDLGFGMVRVVDNGSRDATARIARDAGAEAVEEPVRGYGAAAWRGMQGLPDRIEWVLFSSADGSDTLELGELDKWARAAAGGADLMLGDRSTDAASRRALNLSQRVCTWLFCWAVRWGWGVQFGDVGSLRALRLDAVPRLNLADRGFGWNVEMQVRAVEAGLRIVEMPVRFRPRRAGESKISGTVMGTARAAWGILGMMFRLWRTRRRVANGRMLSGETEIPD
jgi:glycosyltransferase involved in cell wall biosynthesis